MGPGGDIPIIIHAMEILQLTILFALILITVGLFPVQKVSLILAPASLLVAMMFLTHQGDMNIDFFSISSAGVSLLILFIIIRLGSIWICQIVTEPVLGQQGVIRKLQGSLPGCFLIVIQAHLFISLLESDYLWNYLMTNRSIVNHDILIEQVKHISLSLLLLLLPIILAGVLVSFVMFIISALPSARRFSTLLSLVYCITLLFSFYYSLPLFVHAINGILRG